MEDTTKVKTIRELVEDADREVARAHDALVEYEKGRGPNHTEEQFFNIGRNGRAILSAVDAASAALTQLRMRINLQLEGRDSARAKQLDRILGIAEDVEDVAIMLDIADRAAARERDEGGGHDDDEA